MSNMVAGLVRLMLQAALLVAGLIVAAGLMVAAAVLAVVFGLRLLWARITGKPVQAFGLGIDPSASWRRYRDWQQATTRRPSRSETRRPGEKPGAITREVEDVEPKEPGPR